MQALARRHVSPGVVELDDLVQQATLGLFYAAREWRPNGGAPFGAFATLWIRSYLKSARSLARRGGMTFGAGSRRANDGSASVDSLLSRSDSLDAVDDEGMTLAEIVGVAASQEQALCDAQQSTAVESAMEALGERDREILAMWAVEGLTYDEIADRLGDITRATKRAAVSHLVRRALTNLSTLLKARGVEGTVRIDGRRAAIERRAKTTLTCRGSE